MQEPDKQINYDDVSRLQWACRRGMLELDVILGNFLNQAYPALALDDKKLFIELLASSDPELFAWFLGQTEPHDIKLVKIVKMVRNHARSRI